MQAVTPGFPAAGRVKKNVRRRMAPQFSWSPPLGSWLSGRRRTHHWRLGNLRGMPYAANYPFLFRVGVTCDINEYVSSTCHRAGNLEPHIAAGRTPLPPLRATLLR